MIVRKYCQPLSDVTVTTDSHPTHGVNITFAINARMVTNRYVPGVFKMEICSMIGADYHPIKIASDTTEQNPVVSFLQHVKNSLYKRVH